MAHFSTGAGLAFSIDMDHRAGLPGEFGRLIDFAAKQVLHHRVAMAGRIAEWPAGDRADVLFKL